MNGFNRFDPKYISIGPKGLRDSHLTAAAASKCATLRHGGRYGGSLNVDKSAGVAGTGASPNLKKPPPPPSVATVSKEYSQQSTLQSIGNNSNVINNNSQQQQQQRYNNIPATSTLPYKKSALKFTDSTSSSSKNEMESQSNLRPKLPPHQYPQQQSPQPPQHHQQQQQLLHQQLQQHHQQLQQQAQPQSYVFSIDTISTNTRPPVQPPPQSQPQYHTLDKHAASTKSISIVNQPLPDIPLSAQTSNKPTDTSSRNLHQPLSAANLNQHRSLQRPNKSNQNRAQPVKMSNTNTLGPNNTKSQMPAVPLKQNAAGGQVPPKILPPMLPPKNRHKDDPNSNRNRQQQQQSHNQQQQQQSHQQPQQQQQSRQQNTLPSSKSQSFIQARNHLSTHSTFGYDNNKDHGGPNNNHHHTMESTKKQNNHSRQQHRDRERDRDHHYQQQQQSQQQSGPGGVSYIDQYKSNLSKSSYQTLPHQSKHHHGSKSNGGDRERNYTKHDSGNNGHHDRDAGVPVYYRTLQKGDIGPSSANNDLYSVTEL